ncbi:sulfotransferase domain-containing protein [Mucisphaera sp.]|uniref:sulfotransferase domain-containing protein n=1 Tax=Mucisphaera sp. TaxID=2913024 RepID=UPI003D14BC33
MSQASNTFGPQQVFQLFQQAFYQEAQLKAVGEALRKGLPANQEILIAANPKTGSTLLFNAIARILDRPQTQVVYSFDNPEQDLYLPQLARDCLLRTGVAKLHVCATPANLALLRAFHITPVVQTRNLFDVIVSARDHIVKDLSDRPDKSGLAEGIRALSPEAQIDAVIDLHLAWYLRFYASWREAERSGEVAIHWLDYADLTADPGKALRETLDFLGVSYDPEKVIRVLAELQPGDTRFNVGRTGRGQALLTMEQRSRVQRAASYYRGVDFSPVGLG